MEERSFDERPRVVTGRSESRIQEEDRPGIEAPGTPVFKSRQIYRTSRQMIGRRMDICVDSITTYKIYIYLCINVNMFACYVTSTHNTHM